MTSSRPALHASPPSVEQIATLPFHDARVRSTSRVPSAAATPNLSQGPALDWPVDVAYYGALDSEGLFRNSPLVPQGPSTAPESPLFLQVQRPFAKHGDSQEFRQRYNIQQSPRPASRESALRQADSPILNDSSASSQTTREPLQDYEGIDAGQVDRYGFFAHPEVGRRRLSNCSLTALQHQAVERRGSNRSASGWKRASLFTGQRPKAILPDIAEPTVTSDALADREAARAEKWRRMAIKRAGAADYDFRRTNKLESRVYKGIPDSWRAQVWCSLLRQSAATHAHKQPGIRLDEPFLVACFHQLLDKPCESDPQIALDVPRTISGHVLFRNRNAGGQRFLFNVLHAITLQFPESGYVQGMPSIAATLLCFYPEEQAFTVLCWLWTERHMRELYEPGFPIMLEAFGELEKRMRTAAAGRHLLALGIQPITFATRWYLTLFHITLPFAIQLRVWDIFILGCSAGPLAVLEAVTMALLDMLADLLLQCDFDTAMRVLTLPLPITDDDLLVRHIQKRLR